MRFAPAKNFNDWSRLMSSKTYLRTVQGIVCIWPANIKKFSVSIQKTRSPIAVTAFGEMTDTLFAKRLKENVKGGPTNLMLYKDESVHIRICWRVSMPVMISDPEDNFWSPAVLVTLGVQSTEFSWSDQRTSKRSWAVVPRVLAPRHMTCLSVSDTKT